jgi:hypothetical protein
VSETPLIINLKPDNGSDCPVPTILLPVVLCPAPLSFCHVLAVLSSVSCPDSPVWAVLYWLSCHALVLAFPRPCYVLAALSQLSCSDCPVPVFLSHLSCLQQCHHVLSCPLSCPGWSDTTILDCCPFLSSLDYLFRMAFLVCSIPGVLSPILLSFLSCSGCPVTSFLSRCPVTAVLAVLSCLVVLFILSFQLSCEKVRDLCLLLRSTRCVKNF